MGVPVNDERRPLGPAGKVFLAGACAFLAVFLVYPVAHVLIAAFHYRSRFTLEFFVLLFRQETLREALVNSTLIAMAALAGTILISVPLALLTVRHEFTGRRYLTGLLLVPMIMPPFVGAMGLQRLLASGGSINLLLQRLGLISEPIPFLTEGGFWAVVLMEVLHLYPIMYLNVAASLASVDPSLEDAARNLGDRGFHLFRRITLPLMLPGFLTGAIIVFIWAFTDLGTPLIFNFRRVVAVQIFDYVKDIHENPMGYVLVVCVVVLTATAFVGTRLLLRGRAFAAAARGTLSTTLSRLSLPGTLLAYLIIGGIVVIALLPHLGVILNSISQKWEGTVLPSETTGRYYGEVFRRHSLVLPSVRNSVLLSLASTAIDLVLGVGIAYLLTRRRFRGQAVLDALVMLPLALPGLVIAFGYVGCFSGTFLDPRRNPMPLLAIAYAIRRLPYMARAAHAGLAQSHVEHEEASLNLGATPARTLWRITLPLIAANILAGTILCFSFAMLEVSDSLILAMSREFYPITKAIFALHGDGTPLGYSLASALGVLGMLLLSATLLTAGAILGKRMGMLFRA